MNPEKHMATVRSMGETLHPSGGGPELPNAAPLLHSRSTLTVVKLKFLHDVTIIIIPRS